VADLLPVVHAALRGRDPVGGGDVERKTEHDGQQEGYYRLERAFGAFSRSLTLPDGVAPDRIEAHFDRGVLEIRIPKPEQKKPKTVQITLGAHPDAKTIESAEPDTNSRDPIGAA